jgi:hypothetical protein
VHILWDELHQINSDKLMEKLDEMGDYFVPEKHHSMVEEFLEEFVVKYY